MLLIFGIIGGVLGGAAVFFLGYYQPAQAREAAQAEIVGWEEQWLKARECVVGKTQASTNVGEVLAIRELEADHANRGSCTKLVGTLTRGAGDATELDDVEKAWQAIDFAAGKVATSYVSQVSPTRGTSDAKAEALADALAEMDAAHAVLRAAASMSKLPARATAALPRAALIPVELESKRLVQLRAASASSGSLFVMAATSSGTSGWIVHEPGKAPIAMRIDRGMRSFPDLGWGADAKDDQIVMGSLDSAGAMATPTVTTPATGNPVVGAVLGNATKGLVVYTLDPALPKPGADAPIAQRLGVARAKDGKLESEALQAFTMLQRSIDPAGRVLVAWSDGSGAIRGGILHPDEPTKWIDLGSGDLEPRDRSCIADRTGWLATGDQVIAFDDAGVRPRVLPEHTLVGCTRDAALLHERGTSKIAVCKTECRIVQIANAHPAGIPVVVGDRVNVVASSRKVIATWSEGGSVRYFALDDAFVPQYATSDGKVIDVVGQTPSGLAIARLPASG